MTTVATLQKRCSVCGEASEQQELTSTSSFGWADLDHRPPEDERSSLFLWVQECPTCGYCAANIQHGDENLREIVDSDAYQAQLADRSFPRLARRFLCHAIVLEETGDEAAGAWRAVNAAWACDDKRARKAAVKARLRAVELFRLELAEGGSFGEAEEIEEEFAEEKAQVCELLRRAGRFEEAREDCREGLKTILDDHLRALLQLQLVLIDKCDDRRHSFEEVKG